MWRLVVFMTCLVLTATLGDRAALIIVDIQDCFLSGGSLAVQDGNDVIPIINTIRNEHESFFSLVILSQDWHCPDHVSFASQHPRKSPYEEVILEYDKDGKLCYGESLPRSYPHAHNCSEVSHNVTQMLWPDHCIKSISSGKTSSKIDPKLIRKDSDVIIHKGDNCEVDSYSVFYDNGGFRQTKLESVLRSNNIDSVYVTGLALDYCVYYTSIDARKLGYNTFTIADGSRAVSLASSNAAIVDLVKRGVNVIQSSSLGTFLQVNSVASISWCWTLTLLTSTIGIYFTGQ